MNRRKRRWLYAAGGILVLWLIQPFYVRNLEAFMEKRGWEQFLNRLYSATQFPEGDVSNYISGLFANLQFWSGAFSVLFFWGALEMLTSYMRRRRHSDYPISPGGLRTMSAYVCFDPTTAKIKHAYNISSIDDNGEGDFSINFVRPISEAMLTILPLFNSTFPNDVSYDSINARVNSVRVKYKNEPEIVGLVFES